MRFQSTAVACVIGLCSSIGFAQESALSLAATQPAKGRVTWREQVRF